MKYNILYRLPYPHYQTVAGDEYDRDQEYLRSIFGEKFSCGKSFCFPDTVDIHLLAVDEETASLLKLRHPGAILSVWD